MEEYRNTLQRKLVFDAVSELNGSHPTPEEVYKHVNIKYPTISRSTVYRNLNILSSLGEILRVKVPGGADRMDANVAMHYHICCEKCGRVDDVIMPYIENLQNSIEDDSGYQINNYKIVFTGLCPMCKNKLNERGNKNG